MSQPVPGNVPPQGFPPPGFGPPPPGVPPYPPGPPPPRKSRAGLWIGLAAAFVVLALGVVVGLSVTGVLGPGDDSPAVAVDQEHVYDPDVCRRIKLVVFDYFGEPDGLISSVPNDTDTDDMMGCNRGYDGDDSVGGTLMITLTYYRNPELAIEKMGGSTVGPLMETVETLSEGPWDEGTWGQRVESDVDTGLIARHANLVMEITWHWTDTDPIPQVSELAVKETAESIIEVA